MLLNSAQFGRIWVRRGSENMNRHSTPPRRAATATFPRPQDQRLAWTVGASEVWSVMSRPVL
jgi:hypothetical protein